MGNTTVVQFSTTGMQWWKGKSAVVSTKLVREASVRIVRGGKCDHGWCHAQSLCVRACVGLGWKGEGAGVQHKMFSQLTWSCSESASFTYYTFFKWNLLINHIVFPLLNFPITKKKKKKALKSCMYLFHQTIHLQTCFALKITASFKPHRCVVCVCVCVPRMYCVFVCPTSGKLRDASQIQAGIPPSVI